ncbi:MAG: DUF4233 domain-containing protein [Micrococcaceae bacterium]
MILASEAIIAILTMFAILGLNAYEPGPIYTWGLGITAFIVLCIPLVRKPIGIALGWLIQLGLILAGFFMKEMFLIGLIFAIIWGYAIVKGREIDGIVIRHQILEQKEKQLRQK